jgi:hypothetical protein
MADTLGNVSLPVAVCAPMRWVNFFDGAREARSGASAGEPVGRGGWTDGELEPDRSSGRSPRETHLQTGSARTLVMMKSRAS